MVFLCQAEAPEHLPAQHGRNELGFLFFGAEVAHHQRLDQIADDAAFVLQVVVEAEAPRGEMLANAGHGQVTAVPAAVFFWQGEAVMTGCIGAAAHFAEQVLPFLARQALVVPIRPRVLAAMVEKADVVVLLLQRPDFRLDEGVEFGEVIRDRLRDFERVHVHLSFATARPAYFGWSIVRRSMAVSRK